MQTTEGPAAAQAQGRQTPGKGVAKGPRRSILGIMGRIAIVGAIVVVLLAILLTSAGIILVQRTLPQTAGTLTVPGLHGRVTVVRDAYGVPHIQGGDLHDVIFAQGYVTAQDRLFQMEFNRSVAAGRLAELFGAGDNNSLLTADEFLRTLGLYRAAGTEFASLDPRTRSEIQAYSDGVNAFLTSHQNALPLEFTILGITPQPWTPQDSLAYGRVVALSLDSSWYTKYTRALLIQKVGVDGAQALLPVYPAGNPTLFSSAFNQAAPLTGAISQLSPENLSPSPSPTREGEQDGARGATASGSSPLVGERLGERSPLPSDFLQGATVVHDLLGDTRDSLGSNDWVVDGTHTTTGQPLLANDPHLGINMPAIWYEVALSGGGLDAIGFSFPGEPGIVIGHNQRIAWGVTNVGADNSDLYTETLDPKNHPGQYLYAGAWHPLVTRQETIKVRGGPSVTFTVRATDHGPLLNSVVDDLKHTQPLALKWTALQPGYTFAGFFQLDFAQNWQQFLAAVDNISISQNFVYADVDGNIGYRMSGVLPIRSSDNDYLPVDGSTPTHEWQGSVNQQMMPTLFNPPTHIIATANNQIVPDSYPIYVTHDWDLGYRARRITDLLTAKPRLSPDDFARIQADVYNDPATILTPLFAAAGSASHDADAQAAANILKGWDGQMTRQSAAAAVFEDASGMLFREVIEPLLGKKLYNVYQGNYDPSGDFTVLSEMAVNPGAPFFKVSAAQDNSLSLRDAAMVKALHDTMADLRARLGADPSQWQWGKLHTAHFAHPLASTFPLNYLFDTTPVARPGDGITVSVGGDGGFTADPVSFDQNTVSSMREIIDLQNFNNSRWVTTTGESGEPFSPHYSDLIPLWDQNEYQPMTFTEAAVAKAGVDLLILQP